MTPHTPGDFIYPFPPPLVSARTHVEVEGYAFDFTAPVESLHATTVSVLSYPLRIVPPVALTPEPEQYVVVEARQPKQFEIFARVHSFARDAVEGHRGSGSAVRLEGAGSPRSSNFPARATASCT